MFLKSIDTSFGISLCVSIFQSGPTLYSFSLVDAKVNPAQTPASCNNIRRSHINHNPLFIDIQLMVGAIPSLFPLVVNLIYSFITSDLLSLRSEIALYLKAWFRDIHSTSWCILVSGYEIFTLSTPKFILLMYK